MEYNTATFSHPGIVVNRALPSLARLNTPVLLERLAAIEGIRRTDWQILNLLIPDKAAYVQLEQLHQAVHAQLLTAKLAPDTLSPRWVPFVVQLDAPLHQWFVQHSFEQVRAQLINWLAALHAANCRRSAVWAKLGPEVRAWSAAHYSRYRIRLSEELLPVWAEEYERALALVGRPPVGVLENPFRVEERPLLDDAQVRASYRFRFQVGYFREDDWLFVVERSLPKLCHYYRDNLASGQMTRAGLADRIANIHTDKMQRSEADQALWQAWKHAFTSLA